jgi:hypothetical protein
MALVLKNRVKSTTTTTGTGTITLGSAATGYQSFSVIGNGNETYYVIKSTTEWEVGKGTYTSSGTTLSRDLVFGSSNSGAKVDFAAGTKDVLCAYPAAAMPLGVPYCDDSEIGTDLSGWTAFQAALNNGVAGGTTFGNNNTNGIISTYGITDTSGSFKYAGGVLAPNGDIHMILYSGVTVGQKISITGVVSTYSLIQTAGAYTGGVLAPNGDIHFIPRQLSAATAVGQKINASGVVSTYSLAYTAVPEIYFGGVLSASGEVHFVPHSGVVGQKISIAGVVSTYSLAYTTTLAYAGGVLAPNGDIHFVPYRATVGQKVSAAGVVSTYSLVYTRSNAYMGGVVALNGDIHFIPYGGNIGQKISISGVVSTYSLVRSVEGSSDYQGGVLAPNGDIHFVPGNAPITGGSGYQGGVLSPNGNIYFIPLAAARGMQISTNPGSPLGSGVCLSSFLNKF